MAEPPLANFSCHSLCPLLFSPFVNMPSTPPSFPNWNLILEITSILPLRRLKFKLLLNLMMLANYATPKVIYLIILASVIVLAGECCKRNLRDERIVRKSRRLEAGRRQLAQISYNRWGDHWKWGNSGSSIDMASFGCSSEIGWSQSRSFWHCMTHYAGSGIS